MSSVVLVAVSLELQLLVLHQLGVRTLKSVDLDIQAVDHGLQLRDVSLSGMDLARGVLDLLGANIQLII
jgi:hypothetical protein